MSNFTSKAKRYIETKAYKILNEVLNSSVHGIGVIAAIVATVFLIIKGVHNQSAMEIVSYSIYGASMILMFLFSTLYHSLIFTRAKDVFHVLDHNAIYLLIAGTYTPYALVSVGGWAGISVMIIEWGLALVGILGKIFRWKWVIKYSTVLYIIMGWVAILVIKPLIKNVPLAGLLWLLAGGVIYTTGVIFYNLGKKKNVPYAHVVWHVFVFLGCAAMFVSIFVYV